MPNQFTRPFTPSEIEILRAEYPIKGPVALSRELSRTKPSIQAKASKLGLRYRSLPDRLDAGLIRELAFQGKSVQHISEIIGCSKITIWKCCNKHGIRIRDIRKDVYLSNNSKTGKKQFFLRQLDKHGLQEAYSKCCICGWDLATVDQAHLIDAAKGGEYSAENIVPLCPNHHRLQGKNLLSEEERTMITSFNDQIIALLSASPRA